MSENKLEKRPSGAIKEKGQYFLAFGVVASMLLVAGFPVFVIFFFGIFGYFLFRMFASGTRSETREIFEFYLTANEILRDDERRWYGFEINEAIARGEGILQKMSGAPPLIHFALGALYNKVGDHSSAVNHLGFLVENDHSDETAYMYPSPELRSYVRVLRKIERDPADAPLTSAAVRALERARKLRGQVLLEESRTKMAAGILKEAEQVVEPANTNRENSVPLPQPPAHEVNTERSNGGGQRSPSISVNGNEPKKKKEDPFANRKPISEVLHDIYDRNVQ